MPESLAERILADCRGAIGEVRFGFGSKRQVWAFEDRHQIDVLGLIDELAAGDPRAFLTMALRFHDEFAVVSNAWAARDRIQALTAELCRTHRAGFIDAVAGALVDDRLAVRHWLLGAFVAASPLTVFRGLEAALARAYQPSDHWALLAKLRALSETQGWAFSADTIRLLASHAQLSSSRDERHQALDLLARFGGPAAFVVLARAARGDADPNVRAAAAAHLNGQAAGPASA